MPLVHPALLGPARPTAGTRPFLPHPPAGALASALDGLPAAGQVLRDDGDPVGADVLAALAGHLAAADWLWRPVVRHDPAKRWYTRLLLTGVVEVWLIGWAPGQGTAAHDHGGALGALAVAAGTVEEDVLSADGWSPRATRRHSRGDVVRFSADHVHRVVNRTGVAATTVHAYSPPELPLRYSPAASDLVAAR